MSLDMKWANQIEEVVSQANRSLGLYEIALRISILILLNYSRVLLSDRNWTMWPVFCMVYGTRIFKKTLTYVKVFK